MRGKPSEPNGPLPLILSLSKDRRLRGSNKNSVLECRQRRAPFCGGRPTSLEISMLSLGILEFCSRNSLSNLPNKDVIVEIWMIEKILTNRKFALWGQFNEYDPFVRL